MIMEYMRGERDLEREKKIKSINKSREKKNPK
jgi:hypothetical protein